MDPFGNRKIRRRILSYTVSEFLIEVEGPWMENVAHLAPQTTFDMPPTFIGRGDQDQPVRELLPRRMPSENHRRRRLT